MSHFKQKSNAKQGLTKVNLGPAFEHTTDMLRQLSLINSEQCYGLKKMTIKWMTQHYLCYSWDICTFVV